METVLFFGSDRLLFPLQVYFRSSQQGKFQQDLVHIIFQSQFIVVGTFQVDQSLHSTSCNVWFEGSTGNLRIRYHLRISFGDYKPLQTMGRYRLTTLSEKFYHNNESPLISTLSNIKSSIRVFNSVYLSRSHLQRDRNVKNIGRCLGLTYQKSLI